MTTRAKQPTPEADEPVAGQEVLVNVPCFITGCESPAQHTTEATMPGGVKLDVQVCNEHMTSLADAQQQVSGKGAGVCHVCKQPVGIVTSRTLRDTDVSRDDRVVVSWWVHADDGQFCHESCMCSVREAGQVGYSRASTTVTV